MANVNTKIESLDVDAKGVVTARFSSTNPDSRFEIILDGWKEWKPTTNPAVLPFLDPGPRTLSVRSYSRSNRVDPSPATRTFTIPPRDVPEPEPEPEPKPEPPPPSDDFDVRWTGNKVDDWDAVLAEAGVITDTAQGIRFFIPGPSSARGKRCELLSHSEDAGSTAVGRDAHYEWEFMIPTQVNLSLEGGDDNNHINQMKSGDAQGYTGGVDVRPNGQILFIVSPGDTNLDVPFGDWEQGRWHRVRVDVKWRKDRTGGFTARIDDQPSVTEHDLQTAPGGAAEMYFRLGWYPMDVPAPGLEMYVRNVKVG